MAVPSGPTVTLAATDHRVEHARLVTREQTDLPQGLIAYRNSTAIAALTSTPVEIMRMSNIQVFTGRLYLFSMYFRAINSPSSAAINVNFKSPQTPSAVTGTTDLIIDPNTIVEGNASGQYSHLAWQQMFRAPTGLITIILQASTGASTGNVWLGDADGNGGISVRDIGPDRGGQ